jgi:hypothetical protein
VSACSARSRSSVEAASRSFIIRPELEEEVQLAAASPSGSTALCRHCSIRCVWVKVPSFSVCEAAGKKNTSVPMSSVRISPVAISGPSFQNVADSMRLRSRTTSHFRCDIATRWILPLRRADGRVLPEQEVALDLVVEHVEHCAVGAVVAADARQPVVAVAVLRRRWLAEPGLEQAHGVGVGLGPEALLVGLRMPSR